MITTLLCNQAAHLPLECRFDDVMVELNQKSVGVTMLAPTDEMSSGRSLKMDLVFEWAKIGKVG